MFPATGGFLFNKAFNMKMADEEKEFTLQFIEDYRSLPQLWDQNNKLYTNKIKRNEALLVLASKYKMDIDGVKKKIKSLRSYFSREHHKVKRRSGAGADDIYDSPWFAYNHLLFIADSEAPRETCAEESSKDWEEAEIHGENFPTSQSTFVSEDEPEFTLPPLRKKRNIINIKKLDDKEEEIYRFMKKATEELTQKNDEWLIYGQLIVHKIRNLNSRNRLIAQQRINNVLFDLEMEQNASEMPDVSEKPP